jgi:hypothetical protein
LESVDSQRLIVLDVASTLLDIEEGRLIVTSFFLLGELVDWREFRIPELIFCVFIPLLFNKLSFD